MKIPTIPRLSNAASAAPWSGSGVAAAAAAAIVLSTSPMLPLPLAGLLASTAAVAIAPPPSQQELSKLPEGYERIKYLLDNWDSITTVCNGIVSDAELKQVVRTEGGVRCNKTPLRVQDYMGYKSTLDPLFRADKLMIRATPLVAESKQEAYGDAVDRYMEKAQMGSTMAYTSSWGEANPNGSKEVIEILLEEARDEVKATQAILGQVIELLELPPAKPYTE